MRLVLLLGSGSSIGAGLPNVGALTEEVLASGHARMQGGRFYCSAEPFAQPGWGGPEEQRVDEIREFLSTLKVLADGYLTLRWPEHPANYEDLAYVASQIEDAMDYAYENPAVVPLIEQLAEQHGHDELNRLASDATDFIHEYVCWRLGADGTADLAKLDPIIDAFRDDEIVQLDVFTLNHDLLLERALAAQGVEYSDGFGEEWGTLRAWTDTYDTPGRRLFKLHGSLDWYRYELDWGGWYGQRVARPMPGTDAEHPRGPGDIDPGAYGYPCEGRPEVLVGTFNKILSYPSGTYADQHAHFHESLGAADALLVIGYGFGDKAINSRLIAWMTRPRRRRPMVVVDPAANPMPLSARLAVAQKWKAWQESGFLRPRNICLDAVTWPEVREKLT